jgi:hypothetical protein
MKVSGHVFVYKEYRLFSLSTIFLYDFGTVRTLWYYFLFFLHVLVFIKKYIDFNLVRNHVAEHHRKNNEKKNIFNESYLI